jgi:hypothetical protein
MDKRPLTRSTEISNVNKKMRIKPYHEFLKQHNIETCNNWRQMNGSPGPAAEYHIPGTFEKYGGGISSLSGTNIELTTKSQFNEKRTNTVMETRSNLMTI